MAYEAITMGARLILSKDETKATEGKMPTYVKVYEKLYTMIADGTTFPVGTHLPAEPKLAAMLGVSRMTLRQALELLIEDGLLIKMQGKGNFVIDRNKPMVSSLEHLGSPVYKCSQLMIDDVEMEFHIEPPNDHELELFKRQTAVTVAVDRWYRSKGKLIAYTLSLIPIEVISKLEINLNFKDQLLKMLESDIYNHATRSHIVIQPTSVGKFISDKYIMSQTKNVILLAENLYGEDDFAPLVCNKHYMLPQCCSIEINTIK